MKARHEPSQAFELFRRQFRLESPRTLREEGEHHFVNFENTLSLVVRERADDGNFACFEGLQKIVLGLNRGTAPAHGARKSGRCSARPMSRRHRKSPLEESAGSCLA